MQTSTSIDLALFLLRVTIGLVFFAHGINHIFGGGRIAGTARWFASLGMKPGWLHAWLASFTEIGAGVLLILGLITPFACAGVIGVMLVAWMINHRGNGFFIFRPGEGWEYVMVLTVAGIVIAAIGPGDWSVDNAANLLSLRDWLGVWIALGAGGGGALLLLAMFWRPVRDSVGKFATEK